MQHDSSVLSENKSHSSLSSLQTTRIQRRRDKDVNYSYKSRSRSKDSTDDLRKFYIKNIPQGSKEVNKNSVENGLRNNKLLSSLQQIKQKKRSPTPVTTRKNHQPSNQEPSILTEINVEKELTINTLEKQLKAEQKLKEIYQEKARKFQSDLIQKMKKNKAIEQSYRQINIRNSQNQAKIKNFQKCMSENESNLAQARNKLQVYQSAVIKNRIMQLQREKDQLTLRNSELNQLITKLKVQNTALRQQIINSAAQLQKYRLKVDLQTICKVQSMRELYLSRQVQSLRLRLGKSKTEHEAVLEAQLRDKELENYKLLQRINSLQLKIDYFNRKKNEEFEQLKDRKSYQIKALREKFALVIVQLRTMSRKLNQCQHPNHKKRIRQDQDSFFQLDLSS